MLENYWYFSTGHGMVIYIQRGVNYTLKSYTHLNLNKKLKKILNDYKNLMNLDTHDSENYPFFTAGPNSYQDLEINAPERTCIL